MKNIIENAMVIQKSGEKQIYDAIHITKKGVYTGCIIIRTEEREEFEDHGFIPCDQIQKITVCNEHGELRDIDLSKKNYGRKALIRREVGRNSDH